MTIAHITSLHPQNDNRIFYKECTTLVNNGYDISLIVAGAKSQVLNGVKVIGYKKPDGGRIRRMIKTSFFDMIKVCKVLDTDLYHFHDPELIFVGLYLKLVCNKKVIYDIHENNPASILSKPYIKSQILKNTLSKIFDIFERTVVKFFDALVTARPDISKRFQHKRIITLRNFPILPDLSTVPDIKIKKDKPSVIYVGGMTKIRGINELLNAFEKLDDYELWLLGPISEPQLKERIAKGCPNVRYLGIVEAYEIFSYIKKADIGIITFLPVPNHINTLATKPFEYMACGKPMIMSNFLYWKETFGDSSLYVNAKSADDIMHTVKMLLKDNAKMEKMGKLNEKLAKETYNWDIEKEKLLSLYFIIDTYK